MTVKQNLRCWFNWHRFVIDKTNSGRRFCSRCGMKSLMMIDSGIHDGKWRPGGGGTYWKDISFPDEGFFGLRSRFRFWLVRKIYFWRLKKGT